VDGATPVTTCAVLASAAFAVLAGLARSAELPGQLAQPRPLLLMAGGGLLGFAVAAGLAWRLHRRRPASRPERARSLPLLGEIPDLTGLGGDGQIAAVADSESAAGKAYRSVAASLGSRLDRIGARAVLVTSPVVGDGKTLTSLNLAVAMGESGRGVVLVDADQRRRGLSRLCGLDEGRAGLTELAGGAAPVDSCLWLPTVAAIPIVPAGASVPDATGFFRGAAFRRAILQVRERANLTVVDTPALLAASDALTIAEHVEGVVLVVRPETPAAALTETCTRLAGVDAPVLGYLVNRCGDHRDGRPRQGMDGGKSRAELLAPRPEPADGRVGPGPGAARIDRLPVALEKRPGLVASAWRYWWLVAVVVLLGVLGGWAWSAQQPVFYEGATTMLLNDPAAGRLPGNGGQPVDADRYLRNQAAFIAYPPVLERAVRLSGGRVSVEQLRLRLVAEPSKGLDQITVRVRDGTGRGAAKLADAVGQAYEEVAVQQGKEAASRTIAQMRATESVLRDHLHDLQGRMRAAPNDPALRVERDTVADQLARAVARTQELSVESELEDPVALRAPAELPEQPVQPRPLLPMAGGGLLGFAVAAGLAWRLNWRRQAAGARTRPERARSTEFRTSRTAASAPRARSTDLALYRRLLEQARPYWLHIVGVFLLSLLSSPLALLTPVPLKVAVDSVLGSHPVPGVLDALLPAAATRSRTAILVVATGFVVALALLSQLQTLGSQLLSTSVGERLVLSFRARLFRHVQRLSVSYHDEKGTSDSTYRIQYDAPAIQYIAIDGLIPFITAGVTLVTMIYIVLRVDGQLGLVALTISPVLFVISRVYRRWLRRQSREAKQLESLALSVAQEVLGALRVVKAFGQEDREQERFVQRSSHGMRARIRLAFLAGAFALLVGLTTALGTGAVLFIGIRHVQSHALTLGDLLLVMGYLAQLYAPLKTISKRTADLQSWLASAERAFSLLDEVQDVPEWPEARPLSHRAAGAIAFHDVSFAYVDQFPVLRNLSFDVHPHARLGIAGLTGSGKTTLVSLLMRFYDPTAGRILLDGVDLRDYKLADLRNQFALVLQEPVLFSASIAENIAYARPRASYEEIVAAAGAASAHEFISRLPQGYDTQVGERGMRLSGGERQRLGLARAFLKDAPILILDEPTSSVDPKTEAMIVEALERLVHDRTTILISHRETTLQPCDVRIQLARGETVTSAGV
jgi:ATP-binding cassette subfamily B protein